MVVEGEDEDEKKKATKTFQWMKKRTKNEFYIWIRYGGGGRKLKDSQVIFNRAVVVSGLLCVYCLHIYTE